MIFQAHFKRFSRNPWLIICTGSSVLLFRVKWSRLFHQITFHLLPLITIQARKNRDLKLKSCRSLPYRCIVALLTNLVSPDLLDFTVLANSFSNVSLSTLFAKYSSLDSSWERHILDLRKSLSFSCTALLYVCITSRLIFIKFSALGGCVISSFAKIWPWTVHNRFSFSTLLLQVLQPNTNAVPTR